MTPDEIVAAIARMGGTVRIVVSDGREYLGIMPNGLLPPEMAEEVTRNRDGLLTLLRVLHGDAGLLEYAGDVLGFEGEPTAEDLITEAERHGAELSIRPQGDVGIRHGEYIPDTLLLRLARAHVRLLEALKNRNARVHTPVEQESNGGEVARRGE